MAGDLARRPAALRLVAEGQPAIMHLVDRLAGQIDRAVRIVVAVDPDPLATARHGDDQAAEFLRQMRGADAVVKIVAKRDDEFRIVAGDDGGKNGQRRQGVVRRQQHAAPREGRTLFQMQIGDDENAGIRQIERAERITDGGNAMNGGLHARCGRRTIRLTIHIPR